MKNKRQQWTIEQDQFLIDNYVSMGTVDTAIAMGRSTGSIGARAFRLGLQITPDAFLKHRRESYARNDSVRKIVASNIRTYLFQKISGKARGRQLTPKEVEIVKCQYESAGPKAIAKTIGTTPSVISRVAGELGLTSSFCGIGTKWDGPAESFLAEHYPTKGGQWVAERLGRTPKSVFGKANLMGLHVTEERRIGHCIKMQKFKGPMTDATKDKIKRSKAPKQKEISEKLSRALRGRVLSPESRAKISATLTGRKQSAEQRAAMSERLKGNKYTAGYRHRQESRDKMSAARRGKRKTDEWKLNIARGHVRFRVRKSKAVIRQELSVVDSFVSSTPRGEVCSPQRS